MKVPGGVMDRAVGVLAPLLQEVRQDPVFAYCLLAAALLAAVSLGAGLLRRDVAALLRPRVLLRVVLAVLLGFGLWMAGTQLQAQPGAAPAADVVRGLARFPLYLAALAYGPGVGLVAAGLFAGLQVGGGAPGRLEAVLALELAVLGWLAIFPSPRSDRWAGPFDAVLAYALAWGTAGLALLESRSGAVTPAGLWAQQQHLVAGAAASALLLTLIPPRAYRRAFPHSRIAPADEPEPSDRDDADRDDAGRERARAAARDPVTLTQPDLPRALRRERDRRELEPFPSPTNERD